MKFWEGSGEPQILKIGVHPIPAQRPATSRWPGRASKGVDAGHRARRKSRKLHCAADIGRIPSQKQSKVRDRNRRPEGVKI